MKYWERWIGDWKRKTSRLSAEAKGIYGELLDEEYATEGPLPLDREELYRIAGARTESECAALDRVIAKFYQKGAEGYTNRRAQAEIARRREYVSGQRDRARRRWEGHADPETGETSAPLKRQQNAEHRKAAAEVIAFLNEKSGRHFDLNGANADHVIARLRAGETVDDCRSVIAKKLRDWAGNPDMLKYLRPETLFNRTKFASYKGELLPEAAQDEQSDIPF